MAVLAVAGSGCVGTVFAIYTDEGESRNFLMELCKLLEKRPGKVDIPAKIETIPKIAVPVFRGIHLVGFSPRALLVVERNDLFVPPVFLAMVEVPFISMRCSNLLPAFRAKMWFGKRNAFLSKSELHLLKEVSVILPNGERVCAEATCIHSVNSLIGRFVSMRGLTVDGCSETCAYSPGDFN